MSRVTLIGLPGVGKTAAAQALAHRWGCESWDTDLEIARRAGMSAAELLKNHGEEEFRRIEVDVLRDVIGRDAVIATGGGIVTTELGRDLLRGETTLWLDCPNELIVTRLGDVERPLLGDDWRDTLVRLRERREDWYRQVAVTRVDASGGIDDVITRIVDWFEARES